MASITVGTVLDEIEAFHRRLEDLYRTVEQQAVDPRVQLLAHCMIDREVRLIAGLHRYRQAASSASTLNAWLKVDPLAGERLRLDGPSVHAAELTTDALYALGAAMEARLAEFERHVTEAATSPRVRELFADLTAQEQAEQRATARAALEVEREL